MQPQSPVQDEGRLLPLLKLVVRKRKLPTTAASEDAAAAAMGGKAPDGSVGGINFEGFAAWYKAFVQRSGSRLLAVNFDSDVMVHLREVGAALTGMCVPACVCVRWGRQGFGAWAVSCGAAGTM